MHLPRSIRLLIAMAMLVLGLGALLLVLTLSEATLNIQARLQAAPAWLSYLWWGLLAVGSLAITWLIWRVLRPRRPKVKAADAQDAPAAPTVEEVTEAIEKARQLGSDVTAAQRELEELQRRREAGEIHVALFGEVSTGKSALVRALLPDADAQSDVRGGTTRELTRYRWLSPSGDVLQITDMPGTAEADGTLDRLAVDEATRAHIVVYVTDGDLNRAQHAALEALLALRKPLILVLNKTDRYTPEDTARLAQRLQGLVDGKDNAELVLVSAGGSREVLLELPDGSERFEARPVAPKVQALAIALQRMVDGNQEILERLRDSATFVLASQHVDQALAAARRERAEKLVDGYSAKAVVGAMAAITPGSDLLIQGFLGTQMVRELAELYGTKVSKVDTELLLKLVQQHVGRAHTLLLAVAGNALKSFPGVGTLAGGAMHAVAYGIIFRTLGRALSTTLETRGELHPRQTARLFEEKLGEDLETPARSLARVVVERFRSVDRR